MKVTRILNLVDNLSSQMNGVQSSVSGSVSKLNSAFGTMQKAGAAMAGIGGTITGLAMKTVTATFDTQNALGELSSLGVKDLKAVEDAAKSFSDTWAGTSKADFITASGNGSEHYEHRAERACPYYREWMLHQTC